MSGTQKVSDESILPFAMMLRRLLLPACEKIVIAGSLRRGKREVGDIEMVLLPKWDEKMLMVGKKQVPVSTLLEDALRELRGEIVLDTVVKRNGPRYKRFVATAHGNLPVEMFLADHHNFGNLLAIRTGDADFSRALVTHQAKGGLMPNFRRQWLGYLHDRPMHLPDYTQAEDVNPETDSIVGCLHESDFFEALGLPMLIPAERDRNGIKKIKELRTYDHDGKAYNEKASHGNRFD